MYGTRQDRANELAIASMRAERDWRAWLAQTDRFTRTFTGRSAHEFEESVLFSLYADGDYQPRRAANWIKAHADLLPLAGELD
jgi:hypothetical protein